MEQSRGECQTLNKIIAEHKAVYEGLTSYEGLISYEDIVSSKEINAIEEEMRRKQKTKRKTCPTEICDLWLKKKKQSGAVRKVISGGQTGADRAGLEAAAYLGIQTGGTAAPGFSTSTGRDESLKKFGLVPIGCGGSIRKGYVDRTKKNVDDSDATLAFSTHSSSGTDNTIGYCISGTWKTYTRVPLASRASRRVKNGVWTVTTETYRPICVVTNMRAEGAVEQVQAFMRECDVETLNVAGHRDDKRGFQGKVQMFMLRVLDASAIQ